MTTAPESPGVARVSSGIFFSVSGSLPRGRHNLPREHVLQIQGERQLAAMTELLAAHGYRGFGAADVARRAGVSLQAFYECFADKEACIFAGYDRFIARLREQMFALDVNDGSVEDVVGRVLDTYLGALQSDVVTARAYLVEVDGLGEAARHRRRASLTSFADFFRALVSERASFANSPLVLDGTAYLGVIYAVRQLASDALEEAAEPDLVSLGARVKPWMADLFRGR